MKYIKDNLDYIRDLILSNKVPDGVLYLAGLLNGWQQAGALWDRVVTTLRNHPLHSDLMLDPYVNRAFHKPRGYAGDAEMMDLVYTRTAPKDTSPLGSGLIA